MKENAYAMLLAPGSRTHALFNSSQRQVFIRVNITGKSNKSLPMIYPLA